MTAPALPPLISSDGHLEVRPERWSPRMPAKYRDRAPRTIKLPDGGDALGSDTDQHLRLTGNPRDNDGQPNEQCDPQPQQHECRRRPATHTRASLEPVHQRENRERDDEDGDRHADERA